MKKMVGRPRGRKSSANSQQNNPEFFKIYLPEHNSKALCIPPAFIDNFKGKIAKKATLRNLQGKTWQVELEKLRGKLFIKKGWESFVSGNSLARGEFLIFRYNGDSSFTVKVFGINGCKKDETTTAIHQPQVKVEQDVESEETDDNHISAYEKKHPKRSKVEERSQDPMIDIPKRAVGLRNIQFAKIYDVSTASVMFIPGGIIKAYSINTPKINATETIILRNQRGVSQTVMIQQTSRGQVKLGRGWMEFCSKNKFGQGDECEFEIVLDERRKVKEITLLRISRKKTVTRNTIIR